MIKFEICGKISPGGLQLTCCRGGNSPVFAWTTWSKENPVLPSPSSSSSSESLRGCEATLSCIQTQILH